MDVPAQKRYPHVAAHDPAARRDERVLAAWLFACCGLLALLVVVGGITRLTHSGLSIVQWQPVRGVLPPMDEAQWQDAFAQYRATPEFRQLQPDLSLAQYRYIYGWEYAHRLLARVVGAVFLGSTAWLLLRRPALRRWLPALALVAAAGALQALVGWLMVRSGLADVPYVSPLRLATHLVLAGAIFVALWWSAWALATPRGVAGPPRPGLRPAAAAMLVAVMVMLASGALVAGTRAGFAYNTFPRMDGQWLPDGLWNLQPWWMNAVWNLKTVQFDHRLLAMVLLLLGCGLAAAAHRAGGADPTTRRATRWLLVALLLQASLGVATLLGRVPLPLAAAHQAGALLVLAVAARLVQLLRPPRRTAS